MTCPSLVPKRLWSVQTILNLFFYAYLFWTGPNHFGPHTKGFRQTKTNWICPKQIGPTKIGLDIFEGKGILRLLLKVRRAFGHYLLRHGLPELLKGPLTAPRVGLLLLCDSLKALVLLCRSYHSKPIVRPYQ